MSDRHPRHGSNAMAIRTHNFTFRDLLLSLGNAFGIANVQRLAGPDVIELKRRWMGFVTAVCTPLAYFVRIQPVTNATRTIVCLAVRKLSISRPIQSYLPPNLDLFGRELAARARSLAANIRAKLRLTLSGERASEWLHTKFRVVVWSHGGIRIRYHLWSYPCKPDIFSATYVEAGFEADQ